MEHSSDETKNALSSGIAERGQTFVVKNMDAFVQLVRNAIASRRQAIVFGIAQSLSQRLSEKVEFSVPGATVDSSEWARIESLSQLRALVGGRFQNLKQRWVAAGFPLREHRGDREGKAAVNHDGWIELSVWISKQGFETRLAADADPWLLELKKI